MKLKSCEKFNQYKYSVYINCIKPFYLTYRSQRLFESSLIQYWHQLKGKYYYEIDYNILENSGLLNGHHIYHFYANTTTNWESLSIDKIESLFLFFVYTLIFCVIILFVEIVSFMLSIIQIKFIYFKLVNYFINNILNTFQVRMFKTINLKLKLNKI